MYWLTRSFFPIGFSSQPHHQPLPFLSSSTRIPFHASNPLWTTRVNMGLYVQPSIEITQESHRKFSSVQFRLRFARSRCEHLASCGIPKSRGGVVGGSRGENRKIIVVEVKKIKNHFLTSTSIYREVFLKKKNYSFSVIKNEFKNASHSAIRTDWFKQRYKGSRLFFLCGLYTKARQESRRQFTSLQFSGSICCLLGAILLFSFCSYTIQSSTIFVSLAILW